VDILVRIMKEFFMGTMLFAMLINGTIPEEGMDTLIGLLVLAGILAVFLGLYYKIKKIKQDNDSAYQEKLDKAKVEIEDKVALRQSLKDLRDSNARLSESIMSLNESIKAKFEHIERKVEEHDKLIVEALASTRSAHHRIDEHVVLEHNGDKKTKGE